MTDRSSLEQSTTKPAVETIDIARGDQDQLSLRDRLEAEDASHDRKTETHLKKLKFYFSYGIATAVLMIGLVLIAHSYWNAIGQNQSEEQRFLQNTVINFVTLALGFLLGRSNAESGSSK